MDMEGLDLLEWFVAMERNPDEWNSVNENFAIRKNINQSAQLLAHEAYVNNNQTALAALHECLAIIYRNEFECARIEQVNTDRRPIVSDVQSVLESAMLQFEMKGLSDADISDFPVNGKEYVKWLKKLVSKSPSSVHPFYTQFLSEDASAADIKYYLIQETNLDPKFDDILAFMQIGLPVGQKLELAKNYFDEMGNGVEAEVHSRMFAETLKAAGVEDSDFSSAMLLQSIVSGNVSSCLALSRRHYFKAVGYFGVTEYLAPRRFKHVPWPMETEQRVAVQCPWGSL
ncbi:iron-containing redox enzyme family protein, partial [Pseudomonas syringae group genomosp. 3]